MIPFESWRSYRNFERFVRRDFRYFRSPKMETFLEAVLRSSKTRRRILRKGTVLWRAQLGHDWREEKYNNEVSFEVPCPLPRSRMKPLRDRATEGRVNPKGLSYLYLAEDKETAMSEVRPWIGASVSVAQFELVRDLEVVDCSEERYKIPIFFFEDPEPDVIEKAVWSDLASSFARPTSRNDDRADYAPTQIIAELFKSAGIRGIRYRSNFGEDGRNVAIFDTDAASLGSLSLYKVERIEFKFSKQDGPLVPKQPSQSP